jgi:pimeloyl-ACP methyl ester carboxylesterase
MKLSNLHRLCKPLRPVGLVVAIAMAVLGVGQSRAATVPAGDIQITVRGEGQPVLMIPGLNSAAAVWDETCAALQPGVQCHIAQLPGFAGTPAVPQAQYLNAMRDQLLAYLAAQPQRRMTVMGHSLGGALALMMAAQSQAQIARLVIVDSLPFLAGIRDPNATLESVAPMAAAMRDGMLQSTPEQWEAQARPMMQGLVHGEARIDTLVDWGRRSDKATTAQAMYEMWSADLRPALAGIQRPTLVLGSWAAYAPMGVTQASTTQLFERQYQTLSGVKIQLSAAGFHFLMWDDAAWLVNQTRAFMAGH